jgi:hypothetical protein
MPLLLLLLVLLLLQTLKPEIVFRVQPAYYELSSKVAAGINQAINTGESKRG